jgi:serine/threonine-protein kinase HipA
MNDMDRVGKVSISGELVGFLEEVDGQTKFTYTREWLSRPDAVPVSLTLPLRPEPYVHRGLHPFFENLLPEGWLLNVASKKLKISKNDEFGMLLATCGDCVGAVEITRLGPDGDGTGLGNYGGGLLDGSGFGHGGFDADSAGA